jgi:GNAT superfamily N-acetyltransferase
MDVTSVGYRTDLAVRAAEGSQVIDCGDHILVRTEQNPAYWWGNFLLLRQAPAAGNADAWLARFTEAHPEARHVAFGIDVTDASLVNPEVFATAGLRCERDVVLLASSPHAPPHPNRVARIRPLTGDADWLQAAELRHACSAADTPGEVQEQDFDARRAAARRLLVETGKATWFGTFIGGQLVAQLGIVPAGGRLVRFADVETHPGFRRQGLAGTLVWHAGRYGLDQIAGGTLVIVADPDYPAIGIYESVGFTRAQDQVGFARPPMQRSVAGDSAGSG